MKCCKKCSEMKPLDSFSKKATNSDGLQYWCKGCTSVYKREHREKNREKLNASNAEWRKENPELAKELKRLYYENNREKVDAKTKKWVAKNPEKRAVITKRYREKNPSKGSASVAKRRASKLQRTPAWLTDFDKEMIDWTYHCAKVATEKFGETYHVDHIIPLQGENVSGLHVPGNLQVISATENQSKGNSYYG